MGKGGGGISGIKFSGWVPMALPAPIVLKCTKWEVHSACQIGNSISNSYSVPGSAISDKYVSVKIPFC